MRFAVTPFQVKKLASRLGVLVPAFSHTACLDIVSATLGYRDWHEIQQLTRSGATTGAKFPIADCDSIHAIVPTGGSNPACTAILKQGYRALASAVGSDRSPVFGAPSFENQSGSFGTFGWLLADLGMFEDRLEVPHRRTDVAGMPTDGSVFYKLALTDALLFFELKEEPTESDSNDGNLVVYSVPLPYGKPWPADIGRWLDSSKAKFKPAEHGKFAELALAGPSQPVGLVDDALVSTGRACVKAFHTKDEDLKGAVVVEFRSVCSRSQPRADVTIKLPGCLFEDAAYRLKGDGMRFQVATGLQNVIGTPLRRLTWAMLGCDDAELNVHFETPKVEKGSRQGKYLMELAEYVMEMTHDDESLAHAWEEESGAPGLHISWGWEQVAMFDEPRRT